MELSFLQQLNKYLLLWGLPGLLIISFTDSAAVPMMGGLDALVVLLSYGVLRNIEIWPFLLLAPN